MFPRRFRNISNHFFCKEPFIVVTSGRDFSLPPGCLYNDFSINWFHTFLLLLDTRGFINKSYVSFRLVGDSGEGAVCPGCALDAFEAVGQLLKISVKLICQLLYALVIKFNRSVLQFLRTVSQLFYAVPKLLTAVFEFARSVS